MAKRCDGGQDNGTQAVTKHVGVVAPDGKTGAALANCYVTGWIAEKGGQGLGANTDK